nr:hypothetical protein Q903MT_gene3377 [Picea sitchensis]
MPPPSTSFPPTLRTRPFSLYHELHECLVATALLLFRLCYLPSLLPLTTHLTLPLLCLALLILLATTTYYLLGTAEEPIPIQK